MGMWFDQDLLLKKYKFWHLFRNCVSHSWSLMPQCTRKTLMRTLASNDRVSKALTQSTIQGHNFVFPLQKSGVSPLSDIDQGNQLSYL